LNPGKVPYTLLRSSLKNVAPQASEVVSATRAPFGKTFSDIRPPAFGGLCYTIVVAVLP